MYLSLPFYVSLSVFLCNSLLSPNQYPTPEWVFPYFPLSSSDSEFCSYYINNVNVLSSYFERLLSHFKTVTVVRRLDLRLDAVTGFPGSGSSRTKTIAPQILFRPGGEKVISLRVSECLPPLPAPGKRWNDVPEPKVRGNRALDFHMGGKDMQLIFQSIDSIFVERIWKYVLNMTCRSDPSIF